MGRVSKGGEKVARRVGGGRRGQNGGKRWLAEGKY